MKASKSGSFALVIIILLWGLLVLVGYYYTHKPISAPDAVTLLRSILQLGLSSTMIILAGGIGRSLLTGFGLASLERVALQAALGLGVLGLVWLLVGLLNLYTWWSAWGLLALGLIIFHRDVRSWLADLRALKYLWLESQPFARTLALICVIFSASQMLFALSPPVKWDALMYHLELPRRYLAAGGFVFIPWNPYWGHPQMAELLYTWGLSLGGIEVAPLLGWAFMALLLVGILGTLSSRVGINAAWLAVAALLAGFSIRGMMSWAYVDGLAALFGFAALITTIYWIESSQSRWLLWAGVFAGFAIWTKLTAAILIPILVLTVLIYHLFPTFFKSIHKSSFSHAESSPQDKSAVSSGKSSHRLSLRTFFVKQSPFTQQLSTSTLKLITLHCSLVTVIPLFVILPWLLINTIYTGNPLYPHIFPTEFIPLERLAFFERQAEFPGWHVIWFPLAVTWFGVEVGELAGMPNFYSDVGPLLVMFAIPAIILLRNLFEIRLLGIWLLCGGICILIGSWYSDLFSQSRLFFVLLPAAALAAGWGWHVLEQVSAAGVRLGRLMATMVFIVLTFNLWQDALSLTRLNPAGVVLGTRSGQDYQDDALGRYAPTMRALVDLPKESSILFLWEPRGLYASINAQPDAWIDRWYLDRRTITEPQDILESWQAQGFTHLLLNISGAEHEWQHRVEYSPEDWSALYTLLSSLPQPIDFNGVYHLYNLSP